MPHSVAGARAGVKPTPDLLRAPPPRVNAHRPAMASPTVSSVLASSGERLDAGTQAAMGAHFKHDFSSVRVHHDADAHASAKAMHASAYTVGNHVVFGNGRYSPGTPLGRQLLAHELTHVVQQSGTHASNAPLNIAAPNSRSEHEADRASAAFSAGRRAPAINRADRHIARTPDAGVPPPPPAPTAAEIDRVKKELKDVIAVGTWPEIRKRRYPQESAPGIQRAKDRHDRKTTDLTGLGSLLRLDAMAIEMKKVQTDWAKFTTPGDRVKAIAGAAEKQLQAVDVPDFAQVGPMAMTARAGFAPGLWGFFISNALVSNATLSADDAGDLANSALHESRHAEQHFLSARYSAAVNKFASNDANAVALSNEQGIPKDIAAQAIKKKFTSKTDVREKDLGKEMFKAHVTDKVANQATSDRVDVEIKELDKRRTDASTALAGLSAGVSAATLADAKAKCTDLKAQITVVEQKYSAYRAIPSEADAHEVGDAEEQAFKGWP